jgi:hypothetical protein
MGMDDPSQLGLAEKSKNPASQIAEFLFYPAPFAQRMHSSSLIYIRVIRVNSGFILFFPVA